MIAVLAVLAVIAMLGFGLLSKGSSGVGLGEAAPTTPLPRLEGNGQNGQGSLADYRGRWVLVNFWASWCGPCKEEAPVLEDFQRRHAGPGFTVLGIDSRDLSGDGLSFVERFDLSYPQLRDGDGDHAGEYGTTGVPENFLVDPRGKVRLLQRGPVDEEYLETYVEPLLPGGGS